MIGNGIPRSHNKPPRNMIVSLRMYGGNVTIWPLFRGVRGMVNGRPA